MDRTSFVIYMDSGHVEYILAYWLSAWVLCIVRLQLPAFKLIEILNKESIVVKRKVAGHIACATILLFASPLLIYPLLSEKGRENFLVEFCEGVLQNGI